MRRMLATAAGAVVLVGASVLPAAAQPGGEVLVSEPSADEICAAVEGVADGLDPAAVEQLLAEITGELGGLEPEPVKGSVYDELAAALRDVVDDSDASVVTVAGDGSDLVVSLLPDVSDCDALDGAGDGASRLPAGNYLIELELEDPCAVGDELAGAGDAVEADAGDAFEALLPEPAADPARFDEVRAALDGVRSETGGEVSVAYDGAALVVTTVPAPEDCDVPVEVAAGLGGTADVQRWPLVLLVGGLLSIAAGAALRPVTVRRRR